MDSLVPAVCASNSREFRRGSVSGSFVADQREPVSLMLLLRPHITPLSPAVSAVSSQVVRWYVEDPSGWVRKLHRCGHCVAHRALAVHS